MPAGGTTLKDREKSRTRQINFRNRRVKRKKMNKIACNKIIQTLLLAKKKN